MNLVPYKFIVCRWGTRLLDDATGVKGDGPHTSTLVVSEFIGCSPLSGAIRVNPWDIDAVAEALNWALTMSYTEKQLRHEKHYRYSSSHDVAYGTRSFIGHARIITITGAVDLVLGLGFRVASRKCGLSASYQLTGQANRRVIFLDYDGTLVPQTSINKSPTAEVVSGLDALCSDPKNTVFIVSGRGKTSLGEWLAPCELSGIAAEHGKISNWESSFGATDFEWKEIVEPIMRSYTEATDGSGMEVRETALVWHQQDADPDFGSWQAIEMMFLLMSPLGLLYWDFYMMPGVSKGLAVEKVLSTIIDGGISPD
ncbi:putative alpha,alpha-trehalose-phosphate synthase [UDP-forming] 10 [Drosera capensis]